MRPAVRLTLAVALAASVALAGGCLNVTGVQDYKVEDNAPGGGPGDDARCAGAGSFAACETCCSSVHPDGKRAQAVSLQTCACVPDLCETPCGDTFCRDALAGFPKACDDCLASAISTRRCAVDPTNVYVLCLRGCPTN